VRGFPARPSLAAARVAWRSQSVHPGWVRARMLLHRAVFILGGVVVVMVVVVVVVVVV
jgi:hypothetical protein